MCTQYEQIIIIKQIADIKRKRHSPECCTVCDSYSSRFFIYTVQLNIIIYYARKHISDKISLIQLISSKKYLQWKYLQLTISFGQIIS